MVKVVNSVVSRTLESLITLDKLWALARVAGATVPAWWLHLDPLSTVTEDL